MSHVRQQVREAFATKVTGLTTTGANVFQSRTYNLQKSELPALLIYTTSDEVSDFLTIQQPRIQQRALMVTVEAHAMEAANLDDELDTIAAEIETAIGNDPTLGGMATDARFSSAEIALNADAEQPGGLMTMQFEVVYLIDESDPTTRVGS